MRPRKPSHLGAWLALFLGGSGCLGFALFLVVGLVALLAALTPALGVSAPGSPGPVFDAGSLPVPISHVWRGPSNQAVVDAALYVASGLYNGPPDGYDTWYDAMKIPAAIAYWQRTCPGCAAWAEGHLQCVMLVTAAYGLAGQPLPYVGNAITFWTSGAYRRLAGWAMIPPTALPYPGDMIVLDSGANFGGVGHIVIVVDVAVPRDSGHPGSVQFAEANGPGAILDLPLREEAAGQFALDIWRGYTVMGYIRHLTALVSV